MWHRKARHRQVRPQPLRRYRYSKLKWRILVRIIDVLGTLSVRLVRLVRQAPPVEDPQRILVAQLDHLGDAVLSSPIFGPLRQSFPQAEIDVLASPSNRAVFQCDPRINRVLVAQRTWFERNPERHAWTQPLFELTRLLRPRRYDLGIDVRGDLLTIAALALGGVKRRVGWDMGGGGFLLTDVAVWVPHRHEVDSRMALLTQIGIPIEKPYRVSIHVTDSDRIAVLRRLRACNPSRIHSHQSVRNHQLAMTLKDSEPSHITPRADFWFHQDSPMLDWEIAPNDADGDLLHAGRFGDEQPLLVAHLGAGTQAKRWPMGHWCDLLERFLEDGWRIVLIGGPEDRDRAAMLTPHRHVMDWTGLLPIAHTGAILERADLFIGADSGPAHLAACTGVTSVVLFSGTNRVAQWRPRSRRCLVLRHSVPCRPCHQKVCPLANHPCLTELNPERVYRSASRWYARCHQNESPHAPLV